MDLELIHTGDIARVTATDAVLDPAAAIAVWPYYQTDFDDPAHVGDVLTKRGARKDMTVEDPVWEPDIKHSFHGTRITFATEDGGRYAVVNWNGTDDPPYLYLLVIGGEGPEDRRWDKLDAVERVERYGEPEDRNSEWSYRLPSEDIPPHVVEQDADPSFALPGSNG